MLLCSGKCQSHFESCCVCGDDGLSSYGEWSVRCGDTLLRVEDGGRGMCSDGEELVGAGKKEANEAHIIHGVYIVNREIMQGMECVILATSLL